MKKGRAKMHGEYHAVWTTLSVNQKLLNYCYKLIPHEYMLT